MPPIHVAGRAVFEPLAVVVRYLEEHRLTVANYDSRAGNFETLSPEVVATSRWIRSRVSNEHARWFVEHGAAADWTSVAPGESLAEADPLSVGGSYDRAAALFAWFQDSAPKGVALGKISKVLYLMRPDMFPILDSHLQKLYADAAAEAARELAPRRVEFSGYRRMYWAAIQRDLIENREALASLRTALASLDDPFASEVSERVTNLRLLDILAWSLGPDGLAGQAPRSESNPDE